MGCGDSKVSPHCDGEPPKLTKKQQAAWKAKLRWIAKHLLFPALAAAAKPEPGWQLPKLTVEQQAEWEEKKERIAEQLAKPNTKWDQMGASVLKQALGRHQAGGCGLARGPFRCRRGASKMPRPASRGCRHVRGYAE